METLWIFLSYPVVSSIGGSFWMDWLFAMEMVVNMSVFVCRFQPQDMEVQLSDELAGSLRRLKVLPPRTVLMFACSSSLTFSSEVFICQWVFGSFLIGVLYQHSVRSYSKLLSYSLTLQRPTFNHREPHSFTLANYQWKIPPLLFYLPPLCLRLILKISLCAVNENV